MDGDGQDPAAWQLQADWHLPRYAQRQMATDEAWRDAPAQSRGDSRGDAARAQ
jgi:hypothetical protein